MATSLIMLGILLVPLIATWSLSRLGLGLRTETGGVIGLVLTFLFTASGHYIMPLPMAEMLPPFVPWRLELIYLTGVLEIGLALGLAWPATRRLTGLAAIAVLVLFFPANVYAAFAHVGTGGHVWGPAYLLIRAPLQALLIAWVWWFAVRAPAPRRPDRTPAQLLAAPS